MSEYIYEHVQSGADHMGRPVEHPTLVQREEIVRCRDCENLNIVDKCPCGFWALENLNGFCAWSERKGGRRMSVIDKLLKWDELRVRLEAAEQAGIEIAKENADLRIENELLKRELAALKEGGE